jgi:hypothetical protein
VTVSSPNAVSFDQLYADHDKDPKATAEALRRMADDKAVEPQNLRRFAWLVNHLMGEKLEQWDKAASTLEKVVADCSEAPCLSQLAVAATLSGKPVRALALLPRIAQLAEAPVAAANAAVQLGILQFAKPSDTLGTQVQAFIGVLAVLEPLVGQLGKLATPIAGHLNNVTSRLMDNEGADVRDPQYREALMRGANAAKTIWSAAGNWMNHERADYLVALCGNRLQDHSVAKEAAVRGIQTIAEGGTEDVDRAFLLLELSRAERGLGNGQAASAAREEAMRLADAFDSDLRSWFDSRAKA